MSRLVFLDTETTGLDPERHEIWEVAAIIRDDDLRTECVWQLPVDLGKADTIALNIGRFHDRRWEQYEAYEPGTGTLRPQSFLDPQQMTWDPREMESWAYDFTRLTWGAHLVGAVVSFDAERLERLCRFWGSCPGWHYHLVDVEALAAGFITGRARGIAMTALSDPQANLARAAGIDVHGIGAWRGALDLSGAAVPPWSSEDLSNGVGVNPDLFDRHTALGDARWAEAVFDAVVSPKPPARPEN